MRKSTSVSVCREEVQVWAGVFDGVSSQASWSLLGRRPALSPHLSFHLHTPTHRNASTSLHLHCPHLHNMTQFFAYAAHAPTGCRLSGDRRERAVGRPTCRRGWAGPAITSPHHQASGALTAQILMHAASRQITGHTRPSTTKHQMSGAHSKASIVSLYSPPPTIFRLASPRIALSIFEGCTHTQREEYAGWSVYHLSLLTRLKIDVPSPPLYRRDCPSLSRLPWKLRMHMHTIKPCSATPVKL